MKQIQHTALRKKVSCYHYLIKSSDNLKPFLQLFNNRSKNSLTSIGTPLKKSLFCIKQYNIKCFYLF